MSVVCAYAQLNLPKRQKIGRARPRANDGTAALDLAKRAGRKDGWQKDTLTLYAKEQPKRNSFFR